MNFNDAVNALKQQNLLSFDYKFLAAAQDMPNVMTAQLLFGAIGAAISAANQDLKSYVVALTDNALVFFAFNKQYFYRGDNFSVPFESVKKLKIAGRQINIIFKDGKKLRISMRNKEKHYPEQKEQAKGIKLCLKEEFKKK